MTAQLTQLTLDPNLYAPTDEEVAFFKGQTGIENDEELKEHVLAVQKEAWAVVNYLCIRIFSFMKLGIASHPKYSEFLKLRNERPGAIFLELAAFFGTDVRKAIADGYPAENVIASDLEPVFWNLGHKLFKSTPKSFPVPFVECDILDANHIVPHSPFYSPPTTPRPDLKSLTSLTPLQGHVSAIHNGSLFHLFDEEAQLSAARALASLLSPEPGSMIFGHHVAQPAAGANSFVHGRGKLVYLHSPETWCALWDGTVFEKGTVDVWARLIEIKEPGIKMKIGEEKTYVMFWCVTRL